jgi:hypothetical protein
MTKPTMTSQWDPGNYRPLDMSKIPGYPRKMPLSYKKFLPRFFGLDGESLDYHMSKFWEFFQYHPVRDEAEDLVMKLFSASLHEGAKKWYDDLPVASITSMDHFEKVFLERWALKLEDVQSLLKELEGIKQASYEVVKVFRARFQKLFYQIPECFLDWKASFERVALDSLCFWNLVLFPEFVEFLGVYLCMSPFLVFLLSFSFLWWLVLGSSELALYLLHPRLLPMSLPLSLKAGFPGFLLVLTVEVVPY